MLLRIIKTPLITLVLAGIPFALLLVPNKEQVLFELAYTIPYLGCAFVAFLCVGAGKASRGRRRISQEENRIISVIARTSWHELDGIDSLCSQ